MSALAVVTAVDSSVSYAGTSTNIANAALDHFFPTSGVTFEAGDAYSSDVNAIEIAIYNNCLEAAGFQGTSYSPQPYVGNNTEFPNLPYLRSHGFSVSEGPTPDPTKGMSASEKKAYNQQSSDCSQKISSKFASLQTLGGPLQNQWFNIVAQIDQTKAVRKGIKQFSTCAAKSGVDVTGINDFFQYLGAQMNRSGHSEAVELHLAGIYATCLTPVETLRDNLRSTARKNFFASNAEQIKQLTNRVNSIVKVLGNEYHIKWRTN
ncbi:MAG: hypothetical protein WCF25_07850 [Acidimicrobiales bacterium]